MASKVQRIKAPAAILQLHIELRGTKPKVWRRVLVPDTITLAKLHLVIHAAFGWSHSHLHEFVAGDGERYGTPDPMYDDPGSVTRESTRLTTDPEPVDAELRLRLRGLLGPPHQGREEDRTDSGVRAPVLCRWCLCNTAGGLWRHVGLCGVRAGYGEPWRSRARQPGQMDRY
jgi:hypothetical protein